MLNICSVWLISHLKLLTWFHHQRKLPSLRSQRATLEPKQPTLTGPSLSIFVALKPSRSTDAKLHNRPASKCSPDGHWSQHGVPNLPRTVSLVPDPKWASYEAHSSNSNNTKSHQQSTVWNGVIDLRLQPQIIHRFGVCFFFIVLVSLT